MKKNVTLRDIANEIGCSAVTVSKALADKEGVSEDVRERIKSVASRLGYRQPGSKQSGSLNIGILVPRRFIKDDDNAFYLRVYQHLVQTLMRYHCYAIMEVVSSKAERELTKPNLFEDGKVDGIIMLGQMSSEYVAMIGATEPRFVLFDFYDKLQDVDAVISDSVYGSYRAANYLIAQGHKAIGFVGSIGATHSILDRYLGLYKALLENGYRMEPEWLIEDRDADGLIIRLTLPAKENMPTAFLCNNDTISYKLIEQLTELGYRVPDDISVVGFDNYAFSTLSAIKLTTVEVNIEAMSEIATDLIIKTIRGEKHIKGIHIVESKLILRDSVKPINKRK